MSRIPNEQSYKAQSKARLFVGQLEPGVTEFDVYPVFSAFGTVLYLNITRHSTKVTPTEERHIPCAFIWYETTKEADAAIAALHNRFSFSDDDEDTKKRYIQVSYADKSPEMSTFGGWQKQRAEGSRNAKPRAVMPQSTSGWSVSSDMTPSASYEDLSNTKVPTYGAVSAMGFGTPVNQYV
ncbi:RNA-binding protein [Angomonas deanei]|uniref:RNA recognition motif. (A.k.a. RRM, RBD, or RNP domain), putative n=1 Tax=Angomonas deanei TaxID=59799 RepID=A0A7G2C452_9TRYP|nr:RNA-binding protein [Angomonas deanei]CAD2213503.1 RNA recognition motif. (a.k.a. RRM, RBD, or RNP domain), putative [Angomonas deanei]|eukprot:EPY21402.1 RNA-binding protein [Angomonas deanei]